MVSEKSMDYDGILNRIKVLEGRKNSGSYKNLNSKQSHLYEVIKKMSIGDAELVLKRADIETECGPNFDFNNRDNLITDFCYNKVNKEDNENKFLISPKTGKFRFVDFNWNSNEMVKITWKITDLKSSFSVGTYVKEIFYWDFKKLKNAIQRTKGNSSLESTTIHRSPRLSKKKVITEQQSESDCARINELWFSDDQEKWGFYLDRYWSYVKPENMSIEKELNQINSELVKNFDECQWYGFLRNKYFPWKYTDKRRLKVNLDHLSYYENRESQLLDIKNQIFAFDKSDIIQGLSIANQIKGLGTAGASGLLAILFPQYFGTVDKFVVEALSSLNNLNEHYLIKRMLTKSGLNINDGKILIDVMRCKARKLNQIFNTERWNPRKVDMVLWACR